MRWLVPTAAATSRSDRSPIPRAATSFTTASSSSWRRSRSGARAIDAPLLASGLETLCLQFEVAPCHSAHQHANDRAERPALVELLPNSGAPVRFLDDAMTRDGHPAGRALHPSPRRTRGQLGDLPHQLRHSRLLDLEPLAAREPRRIERNEPGNRRGPFGPALDVAEHLPDDTGRRFDLDAAISNHVPYGT